MIDEGILSIDLVPAWDTPDVRQRLAQTLRTSNALRAAIAYWTVTNNFVHSCLSSRLAVPHGFLCVDIHLPTDIDELVCLVRQGADVRLYCEEIPTPGDGNLKYLVHSKMLLFWAADRTAELWVGSHNWTRRALVGLNVESSLRVRMSDTCGLFCDAATYLEHVKAICEPFDLSKVEYYKELQGIFSREKTVRFVEIEATDASALANSTITVFGSDPTEVQEVAPLEPVYVSAFNDSGNEEYIYSATVVHAGVMEGVSGVDPGIKYDARRYAFRYGRKFPRLRPVEELDRDVLKNAAYVIILSVDQLIPGVQALDPAPREDVWDSVDSERSPLLRRLAPDQVKALFQTRTPKVRRPVDYRSAVPRVAVLEERRSLNEHRLVVKRILRPR